ncbi:helix-turn-helix domain-containing protein [Ralstonia mannitolilytica]|uniref:helix-turn-helix domain-containing protein n=1 Tax=Ralstonia mannitolilytica TaxID=105219 RepID=UPI000CEF0DFE|nr:helix-turn-helix domain-containing protein [Ralstonia mannitolilytica]MBU9577874.1 helix-turn-helix domain-containing protein [Ralstonia mannitolilytica]
MAKKKATTRAAALKQILVQIPGNDSASQRQRALTAMQTLGSVTTFELMRHLDVYDPRPRIFELRHHLGHRIKTVTRVEHTEAGIPHRVGVYLLEVATC